MAAWVEEDAPSIPVVSEDEPRRLRLGARILRLGQRARPRARLDSGLDRLRFLVDTFPRNTQVATSAAAYQPLPMLGIAGRRSDGTYSRWLAIERFLDELPEPPATALDIGCNAGFFTLGLARRGLVAVGVEPSPPALRTAMFALRREEDLDAGFLSLEVTPRTVDVLPGADVVLLLSLWHHFVRRWDLARATELLQAIWNRTEHTLFFDTGESEMPAGYGLPPMVPTARSWLEGYLAATCEGSAVVHLGRHAARAPSGENVLRNLFAVRRVRSAARRRAA